MVFLDPPFHFGLAEQAITLLEEKNWLLPHALIYVETEKEQQVSRQEESTWNQEYLHAIIVGMEWTAVGIGVVLVLTGLYRLLFKSKKGGGKA